MAMTIRPEKRAQRGEGRAHGSVMVPTGRRRNEGAPAVRPGTVDRCAVPTPSRPGCSPGSRPRRRSRPCAGADSTVVGVDPAEVVVAAGADGVPRPSTASARASGSGWCAFELGHASERVVGHAARRSRRRRSPMSCSPGSTPSRWSTTDGARHRARATGPGRAAARARGRALDRPRPEPRARPVADRQRRGGTRASTATTTSDARRDDPRAAARGRVLPGEPHASAHVRPRARPGRALRRARAARTPRRTPRCCASRRSAAGTAVVSASPERLLRRRGRATSRPARSRARPRPRAALARQRQGPRRERDDRRPRPQRPRARVRARVDPGAGAVRGRGAPRAAPPREHGARPRCATTSASARSCAATFPPASVTGAPKPRVLQAIEDLEPVRRGVYCGAVGLDRHRPRDATPTSPSPSARSPCSATGDHGCHPPRASAAGSSPTRGPTPSGTRPSSRPAASSRVAGAERRRTPVASVSGPHDASSGSTACCSTPTTARISPFDHGLLVGDGVFETIRVYGGAAVRVDAVTSTASRTRPPGSGSPCPTATSCAPRPTRCSRPTGSRRRGCASPSPAASRRSAPSAASRRPR